MPHRQAPSAAAAAAPDKPMAPDASPGTASMPLPEGLGWVIIRHDTAQGQIVLYEPASRQLAVQPLSRLEMHIPMSSNLLTSVPSRDSAEAAPSASSSSSAYTTPIQQSASSLSTMSGTNLPSIALSLIPVSMQHASSSSHERLPGQAASSALSEYNSSEIGQIVLPGHSAMSNPNYRMYHHRYDSPTRLLTCPTCHQRLPAGFRLFARMAEDVDEPDSAFASGVGSGSSSAFNSGDADGDSGDDVNVNDESGQSDNEDVSLRSGHVWSRRRRSRASPTPAAAARTTSISLPDAPQSENMLVRRNSHLPRLAAPQGTHHQTPHAVSGEQSASSAAAASSSRVQVAPLTMGDLVPVGRHIHADPNYFSLLAAATHPSPLPSLAASSSQSSAASSSQPAQPLHAAPTGSQASADVQNDDDDDDDLLPEAALNTGYYKRFFIEEQRIGSGLRGQVFKCRHEIDNLFLGHYAVKKVPVGDRKPWLLRMLREVHLLNRLHHANIIGYKHAWCEMHQSTPFGPAVPCLFILIDYANAGNLAQYLWARPRVADASSSHVGESPRAIRAAARRKRLDAAAAAVTAGSQDDTNPDPLAAHARYLPDEEILRLFLDITRGLHHLHSHGIIHRDVKPQNMLLTIDAEDEDAGGRGASTSDNNSEGTAASSAAARRRSLTGRMRALVSDFGECENEFKPVLRNRTGATGTLEFVAPELLAVDAATGQFPAAYSTQSDLFSLGVVLFSMCFGRLPWRTTFDRDGADAVKAEICAMQRVKLPTPTPGGVATGSDDDDIPRIGATVPQRSPALLDLISRLMERNPQKRITTREILAKFDGLDAKEWYLEQQPASLQRSPPPDSADRGDESAEAVRSSAAEASRALIAVAPFPSSMPGTSTSRHVPGDMHRPSEQQTLLVRCGVAITALKIVSFFQTVAPTSWGMALLIPLVLFAVHDATALATPRRRASSLSSSMMSAAAQIALVAIAHMSSVFPLELSWNDCVPYSLIGVHCLLMSYQP